MQPTQIQPEDHNSKLTGRSGQVNVYICESCAGSTVTIDRENGVTPFLIDCQIKGCNGVARSSFYAVPQELIPQYEWRKPTKTEYYQLPVSTRREHVDRGGLMMYPIRSPKEVKEKVARLTKPRRLSVRQRREQRRQNSRELIVNAISCRPLQVIYGAAAVKDLVLRDNRLNGDLVIVNFDDL